MKKIVIANWKMNPQSKKQALNMFSVLSRGLKGVKSEVVICAPFLYLDIAKKTKVFSLGAQDCFWTNAGAFTGQTSPVMLRDLGVKYVLIGHSEKKQLGETDENINDKVRAALKAGLIPVLCVGENSAEKRKGQAFSVVENQVKQGLKKISKPLIKKVVIAYEPVWAISPYGPCLPDLALTMSLFLRKVTGRLGGRGASRSIKVLYGGSVTAEDAKDYLSSEFISGVLVGNASLSPREFIKIAKNSE